MERGTFTPIEFDEVDMELFDVDGIGSCLSVYGKTYFMCFYENLDSLIKVAQGSPRSGVKRVLELWREEVAARHAPIG